MKNETEELNGHNALPKTFNSAPSATSHPPFPFKLNSVKSGTCWKRSAAEKHEGGDRAKARYRANMSKVRRRPGGIGSEFVLARGEGQKKIKEIRKKKATGRVMERKRIEAVTQMDCGESWGNWQEDRY